MPTLGRGAQQRIAATATTGGETVIAQLCDEPVTAAALRETVLQYVLRTRESIMLDDALAEPSFATYPYISGKRARSILCLPLINQTRLIGALYLATNVFVPDRIAGAETSGLPGRDYA